MDSQGAKILPARENLVPLVGTEGKDDDDVEA